MMVEAMIQLQDVGQMCTEQALRTILFCFFEVLMTALTCATENIQRFVSLLQATRCPRLVRLL